MSNKMCGYICKGCELGARLDTATLVKTATKDGKMNSCASTTSSARRMAWR